MEQLKRKAEKIKNLDFNCKIFDGKTRKNYF